MAKTLQLSEALHAYVLANSLRETPVQRRLRALTSRMPRSTMQVAPEQGQFLQLLVRLTGARRILEIGTFTGYSALAMALALPRGGRVVSCDLSREWTDIAKKYWARAGVSRKITLKLAPALDTLRALKGPFDLAFIDADKENYQRYFERCLGLVRRGGLIAIDNTLWYGRVIDRRDRGADTRAVRAFNRRLHRDRRVEISLVPIGDGLTLALKR
ncbi:MAG: class I SAM-dependent methyltransferase [Burkholderiales bacterium]|nr:class I SAM-dependent methyltransferase [Burkholderiales bacterium]